MVAQLIYSKQEIAEAARVLGTRISHDHPDGVVVIGILKGAVVFLSDLIRHIDVGLSVDFLAISRFEPGTGRVKITKDIDLDITNKHVVVVEDVVDTGLTYSYVSSYLMEREPASLKLCSMLDRPDRRIINVAVDYCAKEISGHVFAVGNGLHVRGVYRNLPDIYAVDRRVVQSDPFAFVSDVYGHHESV